MYLNLQQIYARTGWMPWHKKVNNTDLETPQVKRKRSPIKKRTILLPGYGDVSEAMFDRRFNYEVSQKDYKVRISYKKEVDRSYRFSESNLPQWF